MKIGGLEIDKKNIIIGLFVLVIIFIGWDVFNSTHDYGRRIDDIGEQLESVNRNQQSAIKRIERIENGIEECTTRVGEVTTGIKDIETTVDTVSERLDRNSATITAVQERINDSENRLVASTEQLRECQSIIERVKQRHEKEN